MTAAEAIMPAAGALRVFVTSENGWRRARLASLLTQAGHIVAAASDDADIILSDDSRSGDGSLTVSLAGEEDPAGLIDAEADARQIDATLRAVAAGLIVRSPGAAESGFRAIEDHDGQSLMTPRELDVLAAIGEGLTNKAIARQLGISLHTVKFHVESIFRKLGVRTRTGAIARAAQMRHSTPIAL
jgi:two-component system nitrate/nitrite response regulator NarL